MKNHLHTKKFRLQRETIRVIETNNLAAAKGANENTVITITTTVFSEGACETYSWWYACAR